MAARSIDATNITNVTQSGTGTIPKYTFNIEVKWTDDDGTRRTYGPAEMVFPNVLSGMPPDARRRWVERAIVQLAKVELGLETWDTFE